MMRISIGVVGGAGSLFGGVLMFLGMGLGRPRFFVVFAQIVSLWMVAMGVLMWRRARIPQNDQMDSNSGSGT